MPAPVLGLPALAQLLAASGIVVGGAVAQKQIEDKLKTLPEGTIEDALKQVFMGPSKDLLNPKVLEELKTKAVTSTPSGVVVGPTVKEQEEARARQKKLLEPGKTEAPKPFGQLKDFSSSDTLYDFIKPEVKSPPTTTGGITVTSPGTPVSQPLITPMSKETEPKIKVLAKDKNTKQYVEQVNPTKIFGDVDVRTIDYNKDAPPINFEFDKPTINKVFDTSIAELKNTTDFDYDKMVKQFGLKMPDQKLLNEALKGDADSRYWYQRSGKYLDSLVKTIDPNATPEDVKLFTDIVSVTSGGVQPKQNLKLALGVYSDIKQGKPSLTGFKTQQSLDKYLKNRQETIDTPKFGNFTDTMTYFAGVTDRQPNVVNDLQMAKIFGIKPDQLASNPELYNAMTKIMNNLTAEVNKSIPEGEKLQPYELQSLMWSASRGVASNYKQVGEELIKDLSAQGIDIRDTLTPGFAERLQKTITPYKESMKATIEVGSFLTPEGQEIEKLINQYGDNTKLMSDINTIHRRHLKALISKPAKQPSIMEEVLSNVVGQKIELSRMQEGLGTYEGKANYNVIIPLTVTTAKGPMPLTEEQRLQALALVGKNLNQAAMASSNFKAGEVTEGRMATGQIYVQAPVDQAKIQELHKETGYDYNITPVAGGFVGSVISFDGTPDEAKIAKSFEKVFGKDAEMRYIESSWKGDYLEAKDYDRYIDGIQRSDIEGMEGTGSARKYRRDLDSITQKIQAIGQARDADYSKLSSQPYVKKLSGLTKENLPETAKPTFQGNQIKTWEVGNFKNIEEAKQTAKDNKITFEDLQRAGVRKQITFKKAELVDGYDVYFDKKLIGQIENVTEELRDTNPQYLSGKTRAYNLSTIDDYGNVGSDPYDTVDGLQNAKDVIKGDIAKILVENSDKGRNLSKIFKEIKYDKKGLPIKKE